MESLVLVGSFAAIVVIGYCIMKKLDGFFQKTRQQDEHRGKTVRLNIASSCFEAMPYVSDILNDIRCRYPESHWSVHMGQDWEVLHAFETGETDVAIVPVEVHCQAPAQCCQIALPPQSLVLAGRAVEVEPVARESQTQQILWKAGKNSPLVEQLIYQLCGRSA